LAQEYLIFSSTPRKTKMEYCASGIFVGAAAGAGGISCFSFLKNGKKGQKGGDSQVG